MSKTFLPKLDGLAEIRSKISHITSRLMGNPKWNSIASNSALKLIGNNELLTTTKDPLRNCPLSVYPGGPTSFYTGDARAYVDASSRPKKLP